MIGMPGSGKTTVSKALALKLQRPYVDLDAVIEKTSGMFISDIFETYGEQTFRALETKALSLEMPENAIVSCGGGIVLNKENKALMKGLKVYLDAKLEVIQVRIKNDYQRPLLRTKSLEQIHDERFLKYQDFADVIIGNHMSVDNTVDKIIEHIKKVEV